MDQFLILTNNKYAAYKYLHAIRAGKVLLANLEHLHKLFEDKTIRSKGASLFHAFPLHKAMENKSRQTFPNVKLAAERWNRASKKHSRIWQLYPKASNMPRGWPWVLAAMLQAESV